MATINLPDFKNLKTQRDNFHGGKFFAALVVTIAAAYAGYNGWLKLPSLAAFGGTMAIFGYLVLLALLFWGVNSAASWARNVAGVALFGLGILTALNWTSWMSAFADFDKGDVVKLVVAIIGLVAYAAWMAHKPKRRP